MLIRFFIGMHGHASLLFLTSDGGRTWNEAESYPGPNLADMILLTPTEGWIFGTIGLDAPNSLFVTRDGAKSWQVLSVQPLDNYLKKAPNAVVAKADD